MSESNDQQPLFPLGQTVATPAALEAIAEAKQSPHEFIHRHHTGDWGDLDQEDIDENELSLKEGFRLLSSYKTNNEVKIWIITEADRSVTTIILPEEY